MKRLAIVLVLAACSSKRDAPSCADRVAAMKAHLAAPRPVDELRRSASPTLRRALDAAEAQPVGGGRATELARQAEPLLAGCPAAFRVMGELAEDSPRRKDDHLREHLPGALEECRCQASPEDVGGIFEAMISGWTVDP